MKKLFTAIIALLLIAAMTACTPTVKPAETAEQTKAATEAPETEAKTEEPAKETDAPATDAKETEPKAPETAAPVDVSDYYEDMVQLFEPTADNSHTAINAYSGKELACRFTLEDGVRLTGLQFESVPTWNVDGESSFVVELYKWDSDYDSTVLGDLLCSETFDAWIDNQACTVLFDRDDGYPSGTYLWVFRGITDHIGVWAMDPSDDCEYFENGVDCNYGYRVNAYVLVPEGK